MYNKNALYSFEKIKLNFSDRYSGFFFDVQKIAVRK